MIGGYYKCDRCKKWVKVFPPMPLALEADFEILFDDDEEEKNINGELKYAIQVRNSEYAEIKYENSEISELNKTYCLCPNCREEFERFLKNERIIWSKRKSFLVTLPVLWKGSIYNRNVYSGRRR